MHHHSTPGYLLLTVDDFKLISVRSSFTFDLIARLSRASQHADGRLISMRTLLKRPLNEPPSLTLIYLLIFQSREISLLFSMLGFSATSRPTRQASAHRLMLLP